MSEVCYLYINNLLVPEPGKRKPYKSQVKINWNGTTLATIQGRGIIPLTPIPGPNSIHVKIKPDMPPGKKSKRGHVGYDITFRRPDGSEIRWHHEYKKGTVERKDTFIWKNVIQQQAPVPIPYSQTPAPSACYPLMPWTSWYGAWFNLFNPASVVYPPHGNYNNSYYYPPPRGGGCY